MMFSLKPPVASVFHIRRQFERSIRSLISLNIERNGGGGGREDPCGQTNDCCIGKLRERR